MRRISPFLLLLCIGLSILWGLNLSNSVPGGVIGFQGVYYGTRCLLNRCDPYQEDQLVHHYQLEGRSLPSDSIQRRKAVTLYVNLPTTFLFIAPFAFLPWAPAHALWIILLIGLFITAAILIWRLASAHSPSISLLLACLLALNCEVLFATGNTAGIVVSLSTIAVWSLLNERRQTIGILCFAAALAIKPHDAGLLWLFFMLAGGVRRKRALQAIAITGGLILAAAAWLAGVAPNWLAEMRHNLALISLPGGLNEPGLASMTGHTAAMVIDLQAVTSAIWTDPRIYNLASYLVCGILIAVWAFTTLRSQFSVSNAWLAIAAAVPLTLLITYHRPYDAKLLLLAIPACAMLWAEGGLTGWVALVFTTAGIVCTGDLFLAVLTHVTRHVDLSGASSAHRAVVGVLSQPAPLVLLAIAIFYLVVYVRRAGGHPQSGSQTQLAGTETSASPL